MDLNYEKDSKERIPLEHYQLLFASLSPDEVALRTNIRFEESDSSFHLRLMGENISVKHPEGDFYTSSGESLTDPAIRILILHYLCEHGFARATGKLITYHDIPWGEVYFRNFEGRCLKRLAYSFGNNLDKFEAAMGTLGAEKVNMGDCAYRFEFIDNLSMVFILWGPDEEFPPSSQILFDDNFPAAFSAEDTAVVGDISISRVKALAK
jgi:hypothetical protein